MTAPEILLAKSVRKGGMGGIQGSLIPFCRQQNEAHIKKKKKSPAKDLLKQSYDRNLK